MKTGFLDLWTLSIVSFSKSNTVFREIELLPVVRRKSMEASKQMDQGRREILTTISVEIRS
jgi:hypothetical protein